MTSEQAWDSCVTLAIGDKVDGFKLKRGEAYAKVMDLKLTTSSPAEVQERVQTALSERSAMRGFLGKGANAKPGKRPAHMRQMQDTEDNGEDDLLQARGNERPRRLLARASGACRSPSAASISSACSASRTVRSPTATPTKAASRR